MRLGPFKALIFDQDGTILDAELGHCKSWITVAKNHSVVFSRGTFMRFAGKGDGAISRHLAARISPELKGSTEEEPAFRLKEEKRNIYKSLIDSLPLMPGAEDLLTEAKKMAIPMAIATISPTEETLRTIKNHHLDRFFSVIVTIDDMDHPDQVKPAPVIYLAAARKLKMPAESCLAFEDSLTGVTAALGANMKVVAIPTDYSKHFDYSKATLAVKSLENVALEKTSEGVFVSRK